MDERTPIRDLGLSLESSRFAPLIKKVGRELKAAGIRLEPRFYLSTEYGCLPRSATIGLLWTDGFDDWRRLAKKRGLRTRDDDAILRTLRHEAGHAFCYAHSLYRTVKFRKLFGVEGSFWRTYPDVWRPGEREKERVESGDVILEYAARHPDEDFAVCFEYWLTLGARWRKTFSRKPVIVSKLAYVEEIVNELGGKKTREEKPPLDEPISGVKLGAAEWMERVLQGRNYNLHAKNGTAGT